MTTTHMRTGLLIALCASFIGATGCGQEESTESLHAAWPGSQATGSLVVGDAVLCSATLVAPDVVVTSGRCARAALGWGETQFRWRQGLIQHETRVRAGHALTSEGALTSPASGWRPAASSTMRAAIRSIQRHCRIHDMFALSHGPAGRQCLNDLAPELLTAAGAMGLAGWQDLGWLGLAEAIPTEPARVVEGDASDVLQAGAVLRRIGVREIRGLRASPLQRYEHAYTLYEADASEVHVGPERGQTPADVGSALWMETFASSERQWRLVGVGSRPFVAHSDTSAGIIFSRLDPHAAAMAEAVERLARHP